MKLIASKTFTRDAKRFLKKNPQFAENIKTTLSLLEADIYSAAPKDSQIKGQFEK